MKNGSITKRGKASFRIKLEIEPDPVSGRRRYHLETVTGARSEPVRDVRKRANDRLAQLIAQRSRGEYVEANRLTVESYMRGWLDADVVLSPKDGSVLTLKTVERYRQLGASQIYPYLGKIELQKLDTHHLQDWHGKLLASGGHNGKPLSPRTVKHAHRLLHTALRRAMLGKKVFRNVAGLIGSPKVDESEVTILTADQIDGALAKIADLPTFYTAAVLALGCSLRRGEVLGLTWGSVDLDAGLLRVEQAMAEAGGKIYAKIPKSRAGRRTVSLAPIVIEALRTYRKSQAELRLKLGLGGIADDTLLFSTLEGNPVSPDNFSRNWARLVKARKLPKVSFHALRHSHVSALVSAGLDVVQVARKIGHANPSLTLSRYSHLFEKKDDQAIAAVERMLKR